MREDLLRHLVESLVSILRHARNLALWYVDIGLFSEGTGLIYGIFGLLVPRPKKSPHFGGDGDASPLVMDIGIGQGTAYLDLITHSRVVYAITEHGATN